MCEEREGLFDTDFLDRVEALRLAVRSLGRAPPGDMPSCEETRELLGLFAKLQSEDLRRTVLGLMRAIVEAPL